MAEILNSSEQFLSEKTTIIDYICEVSAARSEAKDRPGDLAYWESVRDAQKNGKKLIFINGPVPLEIIYALDCIPLYLDLIPSMISEDVALTAKLINEAETHANPSLCSLNKTNMGILLKGNLGLEPDAFVSLPISCDSARTACTELSRFLKAPTYNFDIPFRKDGKSVKYIEMQFKRFVEFIENIAGKELDWEQVKHRMERSNRSAELLEKCVSLRAEHPCPMSSHLPVWNELMNAFAPTEEMESLLKTELDICNRRTSEGYSPCLDGEKHRVLLIHNLLWQGIDITDWLEKEHGAVTVLDGFCFGKRELFTKPDDKQDCVRIMCERMLKGSMAHAAGVSGEELLETFEGVLSEFNPDVFIFMGSVGCRHAWAATKMVSDSIQDKYGLSMLLLDIDNIDRRYKSEKEIEIAITQYMDTVINKK